MGATSAPLYTQIIVPPPGGPGQTKTYASSAYHFQVSYPADWSIQINTSAPAGAGTNPEYVTLTAPNGSAPRVLIEALTGAPPMTGSETCARNFVFHNVPACKTSVPAGQIPATDVWVFHKGAADFYLQLQYRDASSAQVFNDILTSFAFTD